MIPKLKVGDSFEICEAESVGWFSDRILQAGRRLEHGIPNPRKLVVGRMLQGSYFFREVPPKTTSTIAAEKGQQLLCLDLQNEELVATKVGRVVGLVGASFNSGRATASLNAFSLGQTFMHLVSGPGKIFFQSTSMSVELLTGESAHERSFDPGAVICFGAGSEFVLTSGRNFWSLFVGGWQLELSSGWVLIDLGKQNQGGVGLGGLLKRVYLPWS